VLFLTGGMAESVDAVDLKSADRKVVGVQVSLPPLSASLRTLRFSSNDFILHRFILLKSKYNLGLNKIEAGTCIPQLFKSLKEKDAAQYHVFLIL
jgi:hypothetical protein